MAEYFKRPEPVVAVPFTDDLADGFVTRFTDNVPDEDGGISTWGFPTDDENIEVKIPYILGPNERKQMGGEGYMILTSPDGSRRVMPTHEFEKQYITADEYFQSFLPSA